MVEYWFPHTTHPNGESGRAWFRVVDGVGYRTAHNPAGRSADPAFVVIDGYAVARPGAPPTFKVDGSFACAPNATPWFRIDASDD